MKVLIGTKNPGKIEGAKRALEKYFKNVEIEGVKIFACHGHLYSVKSGYDKLLYKAEELGCDIALFGHTHVATVLEYGSTTLINPGNLSRYSQNSYCYLVIHNGKPVAKIVNI